VGVMAVVAQHEREAISLRTKAALAASQARRRAAIAAGNTEIKLLGGRRASSPDVRRYQPLGVAAAVSRALERAELRREAIQAFVAKGLSLNAVAARLNADSVTTSRGGQWTATAVKRTLSILSR